MRLWKIGTKHKPPTPKQKMVLRSLLVNDCSLSTDCDAGASNLPRSRYWMMSAGTTTDTNEGKNISVMTPIAVSKPLFQSMIVVTSPMGEKAPPELAAIITNEANIMRSVLLSTSLRSTITITMLVVILSSMALKKKVISTIRQSNFRLLVVRKALRTKLKPPLMSTISTMVIAPIKKKRVVPALPKCFSINALSASCEKLGM